MLFRQLFDPVSSTYTYLLGCEQSGEAVIIDPVFEHASRDTALIRELGLRLVYVLDTHVHADHVTAAWLLKKTLGAEVVLSAQAGATGVDVAVGQGDVLAFGDCSLQVRSTPGHTVGCVTYVTAERSMAFTGDCLLIRGAGRTDFQGGSAPEMWQSIHEQIFTLPDECLIYPGHDYYGRTVSTVSEERRFNARIGGDARLEDFVGYMDNLGLAHPKMIDVAVPANLVCGRPEDGVVPEAVGWGPVVMTFGGIPEVRPDWVARHLDELSLVDVRSAPEFEGELGHISEARLIPLDELRERLEEIPRDRPAVTICQSGKRSAMAAEILLKAGFPEVANVAGGMIQWSRLALPFREGI